MQAELNFRQKGISRENYETISARKHCNGSFCVSLAGRLSTELFATHAAELRKAMRNSDLAAAVSNDYSEVHGIRGIDVARRPDGERRGRYTEIQMGRPTIFHVYLTSDERLRHNRGHDSLVMHELKSVSVSEMPRLLQSIGALDYAERQRERYRAEAARALPEDLGRTKAWVTRAAVIHESPEGN
jgi:hypothetical protein